MKPIPKYKLLNHPIHICYAYTHTLSYRHAHIYMHMYFCTYICAPSDKRLLCHNYLEMIWGTSNNFFFRMSLNSQWGTLVDVFESLSCVLFVSESLLFAWDSVLHLRPCMIYLDPTLSLNYFLLLETLQYSSNLALDLAPCCMFWEPAMFFFFFLICL